MEQGDSREGRSVVLALTTTKTHFCRTMDSPRSQAILQQIKTPSCIRHNAPSWDAAWMAVAKTGMVALTLQGHQSSLFKKHLSFTNASKNMGATPSYVGLEVDCMSTERSELRRGLSC